MLTQAHLATTATLTTTESQLPSSNKSIIALSISYQRVSKPSYRLHKIEGIDTYPVEFLECFAKPFIGELRQDGTEFLHKRFWYFAFLVVAFHFLFFVFLLVLIVIVILICWPPWFTTWYTQFIARKYFWYIPYLCSVSTKRERERERERERTTHTSPPSRVNTRFAPASFNILPAIWINTSSGHPCSYESSSPLSTPCLSASPLINIFTLIFGTLDFGGVGLLMGVSTRSANGSSTRWVGGALSK